MKQLSPFIRFKKRTAQVLQQEYIDLCFHQFRMIFLILQSSWYPKFPPSKLYAILSILHWVSVNELLYYSRWPLLRKCEQSKVTELKKKTIKSNKIFIILLLETSIRKSLWIEDDFPLMRQVLKYMYVYIGVKI